MGKYVASEVVKLMVQNDIKVKGSKILVLVIIFKENCPDVRNTKVVDVIKDLNEYGVEVTIFDPWIDPEEVKREYGLEAITKAPDTKFDAIIHAVAHSEFSDLDLTSFKKENAIIYDVKGVLKTDVNGKL